MPPEPPAELRVARRARRAGRRGRRRRRSARGSRSRRRRRPSRVPPASVATTGRPAASASIAATGVPSFADVSRKASKAEYQSIMSRGSRRSRTRPATPSSAASASTAARAPRRRRRATRARVDAAVDERRERAHEVERPLDRGEAAGVADDERPVADPELRAQLARAGVVAEPERSKPYGTTANRSRGATPKRDEVVAHLVAHRRSAPTCGAQPPLDRAEDALAARRRSSRSGRGRGRCGRSRRRPRAAGEQGGDPAGRARLRGVRVQDVGPALAEDRGAAARIARRVVARRELALQRGSGSTGTPRSSAAYSIDSSPAASVPGDDQRPRGRARCCSAASSITWSAAPPTFSRAIAWTIRSGALAHGVAAPRASAHGMRPRRRSSARRASRAACRRRARSPASAPIERRSPREREVGGALVRPARGQRRAVRTPPRAPRPRAASSSTAPTIPSRYRTWS